jgi:Tol biopolymer transport system component
LTRRLQSSNSSPLSTMTRTGASKIFIMNGNGFNQRALTSSRGGESSPAWSRRFE